MLAMGSMTVPALSVHDAVKSATFHLESLLGTVIDLRLEEVELSDDGHWWFVTLGYYRPDARPLPKTLMNDALGNSGEIPREYKVFTVDAENGQVKAMKMRKTA